ncbi:chorismate--pyruvate lyase family protein [Kangiella koreensis]|uniref:Probable chorismate pyruvate-lyase n=1 Tax=Kangiella koreensis (strain DSM 16069 / JCM 12317 / KCTC 12182 / SW-125) TaxID=523791 RepID=C7R6P8_KANKD|nr:chorismate lyase [Kangiella koreensis]ACV25564.1 Chorismate lyase [Kangiella koreensis DSM 16069]
MMNFNHWQNADDTAIKELPFHVAEWLAEFGSLTEKLSRNVKQVKLDVLQEGAGILTTEEATALNTEGDVNCQVREVVLYGPQQPWIYARTTMPVSSKHLIEKLGDKPLGSILFSDEELRRQFLQVCQLEETSPLYQSAIQYLENENLLVTPEQPKLWARRSLWKKKDKKDGMLVCEVFLPDAPLYR